MSEHSDDRPCAGDGQSAGASVRRCRRWKAELKAFKPPLLVVVGDEDELVRRCQHLSASRTVPTAGLVVVPRTGHTITSEEPAKFNAALEELFAEAERGRWLSHKPS